MPKLCLLLFCLTFCCHAFSQCKSSVSIKKISNETNVKNSGVLDVEVVSFGEYVCVLSIEKGSGPEQIQKRMGKGNSLVHFEGLEIDQSYLVQVEFLSEDNPICRKLQKSPIIIDKG